MSKSAAKEDQLGRVHATLARVFEKILVKYENDLDKDLTGENLKEEMLDAVARVNPAMLSAVSKFLKDNDIQMDSEAIDGLSDTHRRLKEKREARRKAGLSISDIPLADAVH